MLVAADGKTLLSSVYGGVPGQIPSPAITPNGISLAESMTTGMAPEPSIDRMPIVLGSNITLSSLAAAMQQSLTGYRQRIVDILDELLDLEPHGAAVFQKRAQTIAGARIEITPAQVDDSEKSKAKEVCDLVRAQIDNIPYRTEHFSSLLWGSFYGITGAELLWRREGRAWWLDNLSFLQSRRLSYPDFAHWDLYVWDQGMVIGPDAWRSAGVTGIRIKDYPNKFAIYSPKLRGNYPTREGIGRILAVYWCLKRLTMRLVAQGLERFIKPWVIAYFSTLDEKTKQPRVATKADIAAADTAMKALGAGSLASVTLPDSIKIMIEQAKNAAGTFDPDKFIHYIDDSATKLCLSSTFTTEPGKFGSKGTGSQGREGEKELLRYEGSCFSDMIRYDIGGAIVRANEPQLPAKFYPEVKIHLERPEPMRILELASKAAANGIPVDGRKIAEEIGLPLVESAMTPGPGGLLPEISMKPSTPAAGATPPEDAKTDGPDDDTVGDAVDEKTKGADADTGEPKDPDDAA